MCHGSVQTSYSSGTLLGGYSSASHNSQYVGRYSLPLHHHKGPDHGCLSRIGTQGSIITTFNLFAVKRCVLHRQGFLSSVLSGSGRGDSCIYGKSLPRMLERVDKMVWSRGCTNQCHFCPSLADFLAHLFRVELTWQTTGILAFCYFCFFRATMSSLGLESSDHL